MKKSLENIGKYYMLMCKVFQKPDKWNIFWKQFVVEAHKLIIDSIPIVSLISIFIGAVIVLQTANNLENPFIPKMYVGYMAKESLVLEFCSTMIALILAGKIGSNIASEIGSMRITEQIDAMDIMGVNSANYLILPKITASTVLSPLLMLTSLIIGLIGGALIIILTGVINLSQYVDGLQYSFKAYYIFYSMTKMAVFCFLITSISSYYGYYAKGGSLGVGRSSTKAIVVSSGLILVFNLILTKLML
ncbi:MAG: ABC transporter permease [Bacteroidales bacterium]|jgi:phospholipid/cholesterol/gamma-HCH transport system permease protein|nr:ABC transporter permease [Bacteroidales bacterium]